MHPKKNVNEQPYEDSRIVDSPSKDQRKGSNPISTVREAGEGYSSGASRGADRGNKGPGKK